MCVIHLWKVITVDAEFKSQVPENIHKTDTDKVDYNYTVSEGSVFHVDIRDFLDSKYVHNYQSYSYSLNPTEDVSVIANFYRDLPWCYWSHLLHESHIQIAIARLRSAQ